MNWIDLGWLAIGLGLGIVINQRLRAGQFGTGTDRGQPDRQELLEQIKQLDLANRMAIEMSQFKGGFLARTSHELRSPLNGLIGMHQLVLSDLCDSPEEEREFITQAHVSAQKMVRILDQILDVAKVEHGRAKMAIQPVQLAQLLQNVYDLTVLLATDRNLKLHLQSPDPDLYVLADPRRLQQVLVNLVTTAISRLQEGSIFITAQPVFEAACAHIWIDDHSPITVYSEPVDLLKSRSLITTDYMDVTNLKEVAIALTAQAPLPSPGLNLLMNQTLLELMQGRLEIVESQPNPGQATAEQQEVPFDRIQCTLPLLLPEE